ncbi:MAG: hypothetical protein L0338_35545, partial [Acidobacteria bacterium]|nr:hypothetical protein [Acidobacteriota bacterium]
EGFGVGVDDQEPTPALRATPPGRGFSDGQRFTCKIQVLQMTARNVFRLLDFSICWFKTASKCYSTSPSPKILAR